MLQGLTNWTKPAAESKHLQARVFKISHDAKNPLTWLRIFGGQLHAKDLLAEEKINELRNYNGSHFETVAEATSGEVIAATGLHQTYPGQGLGLPDTGEKLQPVISYGVQTEVSLDKVWTALQNDQHTWTDNFLPMLFSGIYFAEPIPEVTVTVQYKDVDTGQIVKTDPAISGHSGDSITLTFNIPAGYHEVAPEPSTSYTFTHTNGVVTVLVQRDAQPTPTPQPKPNPEPTPEPQPKPRILTFQINLIQSLMRHLRISRQISRNQERLISTKSQPKKWLYEQMFKRQLKSLSRLQKQLCHRLLTQS